MKIVFSTKNVSRASFLDICRYAYDYGFEGFEIYDAVKERNGHHDSILRRDRIADAKRKLVNRNLSVSALRMPSPIDSDETTAELVEKYVDMAASGKVNKDNKTVLQEIIQQNKGEKLSYKITGETGPAHDRTFYCEVLLNSNVIGRGEGKSKKEAEQEAARAALALMGL